MISNTDLNRGGRLKGSSSSVNYSTGSKATNPLGRWSLYDAAFNCVHPASEEAVRAHFTLLGAFTCVHPAREEVPRAHLTVLGAFKYVHPASEVKWSLYIVYCILYIVYCILEPSPDVIVAASEQGGI